MPRIVGARAAARARRSASRQRGVPVEDRAERLGPAVLGEVGGGGLDDPERVLLALVRGVAPRGDAVPAEDAADRLRVVGLDLGDVETELEAGAKPGDPDDLLSIRAAVDLLGQRLAVGGGRDRDAGVGVQVVDVRGVHEAVHGGVDRRRRTTLAVQAVVERRHHLVLALDARIDIDERAHPVQAQHGQPRLGQRAEVAAGTLDPDQLDRLPGDRVGAGALGGGVAARVVGVARVSAQSVGPANEIKHSLLGGCAVVRVHQFHPAWEPPTRSFSISSWYPLSRYACIGSPGRPRSSRHAARSARTSV